MALGAALQSIYDLKISENYNKDIKILAASIQSKKTIYTRFMGAEDLSTDGLLMGRINLWMQGTPNYPTLTSSQIQTIKELLPKLVNEALALKTSLYQAYSDLTQRIATTDIPNDKEELISIVITESNKGATTVLERLEWWFDVICMKLEGIKDIIEVDDFIDRQVNAEEVELPDTSSVSSNSTTMSTGKFTLLTPSPGSLDWGCNPSTLYDWIQKWSDYWKINWVGGTADETQW